MQKLKFIGIFLNERSRENTLKQKYTFFANRLEKFTLMNYKDNKD